MGKDIVIGSKTFYSLPKLLPGRRHIVLTGKNIDNDNIIVIHSKEELIKYLKEIKKEVMIIGGESVYAQMLEFADKMYLTHIDAVEDNADTYFSQFDFEEWDNILFGTNMDNGTSYRHVLYKRKNDKF